MGLPAEQMMSDTFPHLLLSAAFLVAPSALTCAFQRASSAAAQQLSAASGLAQNSTAAFLSGFTTRDDEGEDGTEEGVSWLRMSYSVLPLVWAGMCQLVKIEAWEKVC